MPYMAGLQHANILISQQPTSATPALMGGSRGTLEFQYQERGLNTCLGTFLLSTGCQMDNTLVSRVGL